MVSLPLDIADCPSSEDSRNHGCRTDAPGLYRAHARPGDVPLALGTFHRPGRRPGRLRARSSPRALPDRNRTRPAPAHRPDDGKGRPAGKDLLRAQPVQGGDRHLRRALPRFEQRHPLGLPATPPSLRRAGRAGHSLRLPGPESGQGSAAAVADARVRGADPQPGRHGAAIVARAGRSRGDRRLPPERRHQPVVLRRRRRHAARHARHCHGGPAARRQDRRGGHSQDDRQRFALRVAIVRLWHRAGEGPRGDQLRPHRGPRRPQRHRPGAAHGPQRRLHRRGRGPGQPGGQLRAHPRGPLSRWKGPADSSTPCGSGSRPGGTP